MSFLIFEKQTTLDGHSLLRRTEETFSLAGRALLYKAWEKRGKPINEGWHVTHDELRQLHFFPQAPRTHGEAMASQNGRRSCSGVAMCSLRTTTRP